MRRMTITAAACGLMGLAAVAVAQSPDAEFFGHFYRLPPKVVTLGSGAARITWPRGNDTADIARMPDGNAFVTLHRGRGGPACDFAGIARFEAEQLVYRDPGVSSDQGCQIVFTTAGGRLEWLDNGRCVSRCAAGLTGSLPLDHRTRGQPAARLAGYQAALAEWRQSLPAGM